MIEEEHVSMHFNAGEFEPPTSIYLAGPLTSNDAKLDALCREIRTETKAVLERSAPSCRVYDPAEVTAPGTHHKPEDVFVKDHAATSGAHLVVFHLPGPSLGVGMEAMIAASATVPKVLVHPKDIKISRMLSGVFSPTVVTIEYSNVQDFKTQLEGHAELIMSAARKSKSALSCIRDKLKNCPIGQFVLGQRIRRGLSREDLARKVCVEAWWIELIELDADISNLLNLVQIERFSHALGLDFEVNPELLFRLSVRGTASRESQQSLDNLVKYYIAHQNRVDDEKILRMWRSFEERGEKVLGRRDGVLTEDDWSTWYDEFDKPIQGHFDF